MRFAKIVVIGACLLSPSAGWAAIDCKQAAPSRASSAYWDHLEVCGCAHVEPLSRASTDYERWVSICAASLREAEQARVQAEALQAAAAEGGHCSQETKASEAEAPREPAPEKAAESPAPEPDPAAAQSSPTALATSNSQKH
jgi:hypothetical protein